VAAFFLGQQELTANDLWHQERSLSEFSGSEQIPFSIRRMDSGGEVFPILSYRLERDGWKREGDFGEEREVRLKHTSYSTVCLDDPGWSWRPTAQHPVLRMFFRGYLVGGYTFEFQLEGSNLLDPEVDWATWDSKGDLLVARQGAIERYSLSALKGGSIDYNFSLESLNAPAPGSGTD